VETIVRMRVQMKMRLLLMDRVENLWNDMQYQENEAFIKPRVLRFKVSGERRP